MHLSTQEMEAERAEDPGCPPLLYSKFEAILAHVR